MSDSVLTMILSIARFMSPLHSFKSTVNCSVDCSVNIDRNIDRILVSPSNSSGRGVASASTSMLEILETDRVFDDTNGLKCAFILVCVVFLVAFLSFLVTPEEREDVTILVDPSL